MNDAPDTAGSPVTPDDEFKGCMVLVTGGGAGIGRATVRLLARRGALVATLDRNAAEPIDHVRAFVADVTDATAVQRAIADFAESAGRIDILVNNAGVSFVGTIEDGTMEDWHRLFDINVLGLVRCTRAALPYLRCSDRAAIVNVASCTAVSGFPQRALYTATKGAVQSMTFAMAVDLLKEGIRVNCVSPGSVDTPFMRKLAESAEDPQAKLSEFHARQPMGRMVAAEEVAHAIAYLASPLAASTFGAVISVDGGMGTLRLPR